MRQATRQRFDKAPSERERGEQEEQTYEEQGRVRNTNSSNLIERKWLQRILLTTPMPIRAIRWDNAVITEPRRALVRPCARYGRARTQIEGRGAARCVTT